MLTGRAASTRRTARARPRSRINAAVSAMDKPRCLSFQIIKPRMARIKRAPGARSQGASKAKEEEGMGSGTRLAIKGPSFRAKSRNRYFSLVPKFHFFLVPKLHLGTPLVPAKFHFAPIPSGIKTSRSAMELPRQVRSQVQLGNEERNGTDPSTSSG